MSEALSTRLDQAKRTGYLCLSYMELTSIPPEVFELSELNRLDLGFNELRELPADISRLQKLEQLWLNSNPLTSVHPSLHKCARLKVIDMRDTALTDLPRELGRLKQLIQFDLRGVPLVPKRARYAHDVDGLVAHLAHKDTRRQLKQKLEAALCEGVYREVADRPLEKAAIKQLVLDCFAQFKADDDEVRSLIRNCDFLFPERLDEADAARVRAYFVQLKRDNERKRLSAELELKIRCIYFDAIDPQSVEGMVKGIYERVTELDDVKFLIKHAQALFPERAEQVDPEAVRAALVELQERLARERAAAIAMLLKALTGLYPDTEPTEVRAFCDATAALFKVTEDIKNLAADAKVHFLPDFLDALDAGPAQAKRSFLQAKKALGA